MSLLKLILYLCFTWLIPSEPVVIQELEIPQAELAPALPDKEEAKFRKVEIVLNVGGKVSAVSGDEKLEAFDATMPAKMKPINDWLAKLGKQDQLSVMVRVHGDVIQQEVTNLLNVFAKQGIAEISFADLAEKE